MADDRTEDPTLLNKLKRVQVFDKSSREVVGPSKVKELTERKLRRDSTIEFKFPRELNSALLDTRRLRLIDRFHWHQYRFSRPKLKINTAEFSVIRYGKEETGSMSWTIGGDETCLEFEDIVSPELNEVISALVPLCQAVQHIIIDCYSFDWYIPAHDTRPFIPMRSVLTVYISYIKSRSPDAPILSTLSDCFPNAKSLELSCDSRDFTHTRKYHSDPPLSSWRQVELDLWNGHSRDFVTLETIFLSLSSACQNIESLFIKSRKAFQWGKSSTTIKACKLPFLTDIHLESRWREEHYTLQLIKYLLYDVNPGLKFVKVESVQLGNVVLESVEWSRTSSDCGLQIKGASAAVPITELIDLTTSDLKDVTVLTLVSCKIDFGQSESKSPKELGTLREIRFVGSENPLSESDRNKLSELYPNVKVTENQTSQESFVESQEGAGIPSKLDKASSQSLKTSAIDELAEEKVEFHEDTGSQNPVGGEEETSWQEKEEEFDVNHGSLTNESVPDEGDVETTKKECCKRVGADGGRLLLESFGIELEIPPGAIDSKEPQEISLRVLTDTPNLGDTEEEMSVCFGVQCLVPDDLVLRSPVTYTIPHCAVATRYSGLKAVLYSGEGKYSPHALIKERKVLSMSGIPSCNIMKDVLELRMDHFSWAKIKIMIRNVFFRGKRMCCWPFKQMNLPLAKTPVILHAHLFDDVKGNKEVEEKEKKLGFIPAHIEQNVLVQKAEVDLEMGCYVKNEPIGDIAVVSFERLKSGIRICQPFQLDFSNHPDNVAVLLKAGQTKNLGVECLFPLDFPTPQKAEKATQLDTGVEHSAASSHTPQTSERTVGMNPARERDFDDILRTVADKVASRQEIHNLGKALGFGPEDIDRYVEENKKETGVSYMGTLSMLRRWRKKKTKNTELKALQTALEEAGQIHLADELFGE
ncbi:uncharacterized protein LOC121419931 [Lytechinus variegatus]|uniref:uncharacterized protein LOC121419931 n=1 Tax=Lytechinus variegatus TaxID=7654 RepID=UPI001BB209E4|nr:uncharacterized protein LOC121419931 [Lytechinus variegatus]